MTLSENFITPIKPWESIGTAGAAGNTRGAGVKTQAPVFGDIFRQTIDQVYRTQADVEQKQYLLATGQLDDAHSLPIAEAKASLSVEVLVALRNKTLEAYSDLLKTSL